MADNSQKTPFGQSLNEFARKKIQNAMQLLGKALPVEVVSLYGTTNTIVTVKFISTQTDPYTLPQVTIPVFGPEYIRYPIQVGDKGICIPAETLLGTITGLGTGNPSLNVPTANLQSLVFVPIGSTKFSDTVDKDKLYMYGKKGFTIINEPQNDIANGAYVNTNEAGDMTINVPTGHSLTLQCGSSKIVINENEIDITATTIKLNGKVWDTHEHTNVQSGSSNTGPVA